MKFEWDERKRQSNIRKHGVDFADAVAVFFDDLALSMEDPDHHDEQRFITIGVDTTGRTLVVVHTYLVVRQSSIDECCGILFLEYHA